MHPAFPQETLLPAKVFFKKGVLSDLAKEALEFGMRGIVVHGISLEKNGLKEKIADVF